VDSAGNVYVADAGNMVVRKISGGVVSTIASDPVVPFLGGFNDGLPAAARFSDLFAFSPFGGPCGLAVDGGGNVYVSDQGNPATLRGHTIRKITPTGFVTTIAGAVSTAGFADGTGAGAGFNFPAGVAVDSTGKLYVADTLNHLIRVQCDSCACVEEVFVSYNNGTIRKFDAGGTATNFATGLSTPTPKGLAINAGSLYVANSGANAILKYPTTGGAGTAFSSAGLSGPYGLAFDSAGDLYAANYSSSTIQRLNGTTGVAVAPFPVTSPNMNGAFGIAFDTVGNIYASSHNNNTIQKFTSAGVFISDFVSFGGGLSAPRGLAIRAGVLYVANYITSVVTMFDVASGTNLGNYATSADGLLNPVGIAFNQAGHLYVTNAGNQNILKFTAAHVGTLFSNIFNQSPDFIAIHSKPVVATEKVFISYNNGTVRKFDPSGTATTFATALSTPKGLAIKTGSLYVANSGANAILKYPISGGAGAAFSSAGLSGPYGLAFDSLGDLHVANYSSSTVQRLDGTAGTAVAPFPVTSPNMNGAFDVAFDAAGNIYASSHNNNTIQKFTASGTFISDFVSFGGGLSAPRGLAIRAGVLYVANYITSVVTMFDVASGTNLGNYATAADGLLNPVGIAFNDAGHLYVANAGNQNVMKFIAAHVGTLFSNIYNQSPEFIAIGCEPERTPGGKFLFMSMAGITVNERAGTVTIPVTRSGDTAGTVGVSYTTSIGTATALDYTTTSGTLEWQDGVTTQDVVVTITEDTFEEKNETFTVTLSSPTGSAVLGTPASCKVTIIDPSALNPAIDTQAPAVQLTSYQIGGETFAASTGTTTLRWRDTALAWDDRINVIGTATDNKGVKMVEIRVTPFGGTSGAFTPVMPGPTGVTSWPFIGPFYPFPQVPLMVLDVKATDFAGNSTTISRTIKVLSPLLVSMNPAQGSPSFINYSSPIQGTYREVGKTYTITANPKAGFVFDGWLVNNTAGTGITPLKQQMPSLTFIFQQGLVLAAEFIPNPFLPISGSYTGLVKSSPTLPAPNGTTPSVSTEGCFTATVSSTGSFTGKLKLDGFELPVSGLFDNSGTARFGPNRDRTLNVPRPSKPSIVVDFHLDVLTPGTNDKITGTVKQFYRSGFAILSDIEADRAYYDGKTPATTVADDYLTVNGTARTDGIFSCIITNKALAMQLPVFTSPTDYPRGYSYATIKISKAGLVTYTCTMADGSPPVTGTSSLSKLNEWVLFAPLYNKLGCIRAQVILDARNPESDMSCSDFRWFRPQQNTQHYPYGWQEGIIADLRAAKYLATAGQSVIKSPDAIDPGNLGDPLPAPDANGNTAFSFFDIFVDLDIAKPANVSTDDVATFVPAFPGASLKITRATGFVSGTFTLVIEDTVSATTTPKFQGISYQKGMACGAFGFYLTVTPKIFDYSGESGDVCLMAVP
jgi:sugar lactone lactonase YvrE